VIVNPGSVGLPFLEWPARDARVGRWSEYGVLDYRGSDSVTVELHRVAYDADAVLRHTLASGAPYADWWVDCWEGP